MPAEIVFVKPGPHPVVLMPERAMRQLPAEGDFVPLDEYWHGLIESGDVVRCEAPLLGASGADVLAEPSSAPAPAPVKSKSKA